MLLQRVWQTAYNRTFRIRKITVRIHFHAHSLTRAGGKFPTHSEVVMDIHHNHWLHGPV
jgi:hypothetical protein